MNKQRVSDLLCCALEGGSNYWYTISKFVEPSKIEFRTNGEEIFKHLDYPLNKGGQLLIEDLEGDATLRGVVDLPNIEKGLRIMKDKYPRHFDDYMKENEDAITGDVFLQCVCFGEVIFG